MTETLQELFDSRGVRMGVDRLSGVIRGVKILGLESRNGRSYLPEALAAAAPLYEGAKVNVNHPKGSPAGPRDYQDRIGVIRGVKAGGDGLFADFHFNPKHALAEQLVWDAEHAPENVGFSHNVEARTARRGDRVVVEAITRVQSVDLVADPATTRGLFEAAAAEGVPADDGNPSPPTPLPQGARGVAAPAALTLADLKRDYPQLVEALRRAGGRTAAAGGGGSPADPGRVALSEARGRAAVAARVPSAGARFDRRRRGGDYQQALCRDVDGGAEPGGDAPLVEERARLVQSLGGPSPRAADGRPRSRDQHLSDGIEVCDARAFADAITGT